MEDSRDLHDFIVDCEWKTRKILRESNKRKHENARSQAAKERLEKLKHRNNRSGTGKKKSTLVSDLNSNKSLSAVGKDKNTPVQEGKGRDKIIKEAYDTIKSFSPNKTSAKVEERYSSLISSPFIAQGKGNITNANHVGEEPDKLGRNTTKELKKGRHCDAQPPMVTRRTIERDFYIMSKKRNKPSSNQCKRSTNAEESVPELKSSVLWRKYRCDARRIEASRMIEEKLRHDFEHLKSYSEEVGDIVGYEDTDESDCISSASFDVEECSHAIHDIVESHIADENYRSLRRAEKIYMTPSFKPDVQEMWSQLQHEKKDVESRSNDGVPDAKCANKGCTSVECQVPSVPLHIATQSAHATELESESTNCVPMVGRPVVRYISPYTQRNLRLELILNEPLVTQFIQRTTPLLASISAIYVVADDLPTIDSWVYEIYDPCNGSLLEFKLNPAEFSILNKTMEPSHQEPTTKVHKIVHRQVSEVPSGSKILFLVSVTTDGTRISSEIHTTKDFTVNESEITCNISNASLICRLQVCEVLHILQKQYCYSVQDVDFWMNGDNSQIIWTPLMELLHRILPADFPAKIDIVALDQLLPNESLFAAEAHAKSYEFFLALCNAVKAVKNVDSINEIFSCAKEAISGGVEDHLRGSVETCHTPLSMRISDSKQILSNGLCPGNSAIGDRGMWRLFEDIQDNETDSVEALWLSASEIKYPEKFDVSRASSYFYYKDLGHQKGNSLTVISSLAFESPVLAPYCLARDRGFIAPPFSVHELVDGAVPHVELPCRSLLENPAISRLDTLLPKPVLVIDPGAQEEDWKDAPRDECGCVYHLRDANNFDEDGFRIVTSASHLKFDTTIPSLVYGISEKAAVLNSPETSLALTHHSNEPCTQSLSRQRTAADYHYIAECDGEGTLHEPYLFSTHMNSYKSLFVSRKSVASYRDERSAIRAFKDADSKRKELALKMKAAEEMAEARLKERIAIIKKNVHTQNTNAMMNRQSHECDSHGEYSQEIAQRTCCDESDSFAVDLTQNVYGSASPDCPTEISKVACDDTFVDPFDKGFALDDGAELEDLANALLNNTGFLKAVAQKLSTSEENIRRINSTLLVDGAGQESNRIENICSSRKQTKEEFPEVVSGSLPGLLSTPKMKLNCKRYGEKHCTATRGDGWKRLPRSETIIGEFHLWQRRFQKGGKVHKYDTSERKLSFITVNAADDIQYETDPNLFEIKPSSKFIPDISLERLRLSKSMRRQKEYGDKILSPSQQRSLDEILQIHVSSSTKQEENKEERVTINVEPEEKYEIDEEVRKANPQDYIQKTILAVKNHNLAELEQMLDVEGVPIESRDQHGNTLFILASQGGSKKLMKFLLRRGANMNSQNNLGNTALHFLHEYGHTSLAEYLLRKGADDSIRNSEGLSVYEGVHMTSV